MEQIYAARNAMEAHFLKGLLDEAGIESVVQGEALEEVWGDLPLTVKAMPSVWVNEGDVAGARTIAEEYEVRRQKQVDAPESGEMRPTWTCGKCGQMVEEQFTECWKCGSSKPAVAPPP